MKINKKMNTHGITTKFVAYVAIYLLSIFTAHSTALSGEVNNQTLPERIEIHQTLEPIPYTVSGSGNDVVLFIHGFMDAGNVWDSVILQIQSQNYRFITLDLPFMGGLSEIQGEVSLSTMAEAVIGIVDELDVPVILVGQSMGAQIAEIIAQSRPNSVKGLVLITPVPLTGLTVSEEFISTMREMANNETMQRQFRQQEFPRLEQEALEKLVANGIKVTPKNMVALIEAWSKGYPTSKIAAKKNLPVLIIGGAIDPVCTPEILESFVIPRFTNVTMALLPQAGHWPHIDHSHDVAKEIHQFLTEIKPD